MIVWILGIYSAVLLSILIGTSIKDILHIMKEDC